MPADPFAAIADPRRRAILEMLRAGERSAGEIVARFDVSWPAISRHLRVLERAGLVVARRVGRERRYRLDRARLRRALGGWVAAFDLMWQRNLAALERELDGGASRAPSPRPPRRRPRRKDRP